MSYLTWHVPRPEGFKKEYTIENPPNFEEMSKRNPLPATEYQGSPLPAAEHLENNESNFTSETQHTMDTTILGSLQIQPTNPLLFQMQHAVHLREVWLRQQLALTMLRNAPVIIKDRNHTLLQKINVANLINRI